ncbi:MAG: hypothetical protein ISP90_05780 [Nevskia sp.]|nr:hypothetical protein [Nevskia sp.]
MVHKAGASGFIAAVLAALAAVSACSTAPTAPGSAAGAKPPMAGASNAAPPLRVAVAAFDDATSHGVGPGIAELLSRALVDSGRYVAAPAAPPGNAAQSLSADAQLLIRGSVVVFEPSCKGGTLILLADSQACITLNLTVVDAASGRVLAADTVQRTSSAGAAAVPAPAVALPDGLRAYANTSMELAIRNSVETALDDIAAARR